MKRVIQFIQIFIHFRIQCHIALLILIIQEKKHINNRHLIFINPCKYRAVLLLIVSIGNVKKPYDFNIKIRQFGKISG